MLRVFGIHTHLASNSAPAAMSNFAAGQQFRDAAKWRGVDRGFSPSCPPQVHSAACRARREEWDATDVLAFTSAPTAMSASTTSQSHRQHDARWRGVTSSAPASAFAYCPESTVSSMQNKMERRGYHRCPSGIHYRLVAIKNRHL